MVSFEELNAEIVQHYRNEIARFYYGNMQTCSCLDHFTFDQAYEKIGDLIDHLRTSTCISYGAFEGTKIVGYIWAYPYTFREELRVYINECSVKEDYRNRGIGKQLISLIENRSKESGYSVVYLHAEADSLNAVRFYESIGYRKERIQFRKEIV